MARRLAFAGVILALSLYQYLGKKSVLFLIYLLPITGLNAILYFKNRTDIPIVSMQKRIAGLPKNQVLVSSHYYYPFINYDGQVLWFETDDLSQIDNFLKSGVRVFMTEESITRHIF